MVLVTDLQFYMDGHLRGNLKEVPRFLKKSYDCVIIVSGRGKVRVGKSTMAQQIGYYTAWLLAGGKKKPKKMKVPFDNTNVVFTPDQLVHLAQSLPKRSVIVYDEGRAGLDSSRAMENINKGMMDFFQECGQYQHVIIIVLPNFFRLSEDIAVPRSLFLVDVHHDAKYNRGYFKFYNEIQKEYLYVWGKKKLGTYNKYNSSKPSFSGRFTNTQPNIDVALYEKQKRDALVEKRKKSRDNSERCEAREEHAIWYLTKEGYDLRRLGEIFKCSHEKINLVLKKRKKAEERRMKRKESLEKSEIEDEGDDEPLEPIDLNTSDEPQEKEKQPETRERG